MNAAIKALWIEELRNGHRKQGKGRLRTSPNNRFCCLGILCELAVAAGVIPAPTLSGDSYEYEACRSIPPAAVCSWAGMRNSTGSYAHGNFLVVDNDRGKTFAEIADIIEKHF